MALANRGYGLKQYGGLLEEAMPLTGVILGHANPRSTAIYAHVQHSPARRAADRAAERIVVALAGMNELDIDTPIPGEEEELLRSVAETLMTGGAEADRLRVIINALALRLEAVHARRNAVRVLDRIGV